VLLTHNTCPITLKGEAMREHEANRLTADAASRS